MSLVLCPTPLEVSRSVAVLVPLRQASERSGNVGLAHRIAEVQQWLADDLTELETFISDLHGAASGSPRQVNIADRASEHLLGRPGKRIRPMCVLVGARLGRNVDPRHARDVAVASELVHVATLLHDDVIDEGTERRGALTARMVYGNSASILAGDHLLVEALRLVRGTGQLRLLDSLFASISDMVAAEALQLERRGRFDPDRDGYLQVIEGKTAALFRWSLAAGGVLGALPDETVEALGRAGMALGLAFQLIDDVLDLEGSSLSTGKSALADLREGKLTWPLIVAAERDSAILAELRDLALGDSGAGPERLLGIVEKTRRLGALDATRTFASEQAELAHRALKAVPDSPARRAIEIVIDAAVERDR